MSFLLGGFDIWIVFSLLLGRDPGGIIRRWQRYNSLFGLGRVVNNHRVGLAYGWTVAAVLGVISFLAFVSGVAALFEGK